MFVTKFGMVRGLVNEFGELDSGIFVGHAGNKIDEVWQQISRREVVGTGRWLEGEEGIGVPHHPH